MIEESHRSLLTFSAPYSCREDRPGGTKHPMRVHEPWTASGTATFPGHHFVFSKAEDKDQVVHRLRVGKYPENIYVYDPYYVENDPAQTEKNLSVLSDEERTKYDSWRKTLLFNEQYKAFTGRTYLANYLRSPPSHFMWRADYFGQEHWVTTRETRFIKPVPDDELEPILANNPKSRVLSEPLLSDYREPGTMNMTLRVLSCAPRAFEIPNFLSQTEVDHILKMAAGIDLKLSTTGDLDGKEKPKADTRKTRTSFNSWVPRENSPILDAIYRRAADLMRIDESLFRYRAKDEYPGLGTRKSIAESLQLVHYGLTQEYTAHHDFGFSRIGSEKQEARFATLLLYLNEGMTGGETSFPRWVNAEDFRELKITPKVGQAVLFYSQLPGEGVHSLLDAQVVWCLLTVLLFATLDGNLDDFSHHAAKPITDGEKVGLLMRFPMCLIVVLTHAMFIASRDTCLTLDIQWVSLRQAWGNTSHGQQHSRSCISFASPAHQSMGMGPGKFRADAVRIR